MNAKVTGKKQGKPNSQLPTAKLQSTPEQLPHVAPNPNNRFYNHLLINSKMLNSSNAPALLGSCFTGANNSKPVEFLPPKTKPSLPPRDKKKKPKHSEFAVSEEDLDELRDLVMGDLSMRGKQKSSIVNTHLLQHDMNADFDISSRQKSELLKESLSSPLDIITEIPLKKQQRDSPEKKEPKTPLTKAVQKEIDSLEQVIHEGVEKYEETTMYAEFQQTFFVSYQEPESYNTRLIGQKFLRFRNKTRQSLRQITKKPKMRTPAKPPNFLQGKRDQRHDELLKLHQIKEVQFEDTLQNFRDAPYTQMSPINEASQAKSSAFKESPEKSMKKSSSVKSLEAKKSGGGREYSDSSPHPFRKKKVAPKKKLILNESIVREDPERSTLENDKLIRSKTQIQPFHEESRNSTDEKTVEISKIQKSYFQELDTLEVQDQIRSQHLIPRPKQGGDRSTSNSPQLNLSKSPKKSFSSLKIASPLGSSKKDIPKILSSLQMSDVFTVSKKDIDRFGSKMLNNEPRIKSSRKSEVSTSRKPRPNLRYTFEEDEESIQKSARSKQFSHRDLEILSSDSRHMTSRENLHHPSLLQGVSLARNKSNCHLRRREGPILKKPTLRSAGSHSARRSYQMKRVYNNRRMIEKQPSFFNDNLSYSSSIMGSRKRSFPRFAPQFKLSGGAPPPQPPQLSEKPIKIENLIKKRKVGEVRGSQVELPAQKTKKGPTSNSFKDSYLPSAQRIASLSQARSKLIEKEAARRKENQQLQANRIRDNQIYNDAFANDGNLSPRDSEFLPRIVGNSSSSISLQRGLRGSTLASLPSIRTSKEHILGTKSNAVLSHFLQDEPLDKRSIFKKKKVFSPDRRKQDALIRKTKEALLRAQGQPVNPVRTTSIGDIISKKRQEITAFQSETDRIITRRQSQQRNAKQNHSMASHRRMSNTKETGLRLNSTKGTSKVGLSSDFSRKGTNPQGKTFDRHHPGAPPSGQSQQPWKVDLQGFLASDDSGPSKEDAPMSPSGPSPWAKRNKNPNVLDSRNMGKQQQLSVGKRRVASSIRNYV